MSPWFDPIKRVSNESTPEFRKALEQWERDNGIDPEKKRALNEETRSIWDAWRVNNPNPTANTSGPFYDAGGNYIGDPKFRDPNRFKANATIQSTPNLGQTEMPGQMPGQGMMNLASLYEDQGGGKNAFEIPMINTGNYAGNQQMLEDDPFAKYLSDLRR